MRTETLAIVFTDIKGFTAATSSQTHQENARMLKRIERLIEPVVRAFNGRIVKSIGDAYMVVFSSPTEAAHCAMAIQDRLHQHNAGVPGDRAIHIRIAMNVGEVRVHRGDVFGEPVNIAARVEGVTPADEIYMSEAMYLTMNRSDTRLEMVGDYELKGIPEPVTVYRAKKFAHLGEGEAEEQKGATGLPFGGVQLSHWQRMRWLRRAYLALWAAVVTGLVVSAYLRYRPSSDYAELVANAKSALDRNSPTDVIAIAGQIPADALAERAQVRRFRKKAVEMLLEANDLESAAHEIESLLAEDGRDPDALLQHAILLHKKKRDLKRAVGQLREALRLQPNLAKSPPVLPLVIDGYLNPDTRDEADALVDLYLKELAIPELARVIAQVDVDRLARKAMATRLEKLGAGDQVDWVALAIDDLKSTNCKIKKAAITRLLGDMDERAVGPLMKVAESKGCGAKEGKRAAETILAK